MQHEQRDRKTILLDTAEQLFREEGYAAVSLSRLARDVEIRKPTIYHYFPDGKEELFVAVQIRMFERIGHELHRVITESEPDLSQQFHAAARWFLANPPMFILSMMHKDMAEISPQSRNKLGRASYGLLMGPLMEAVRGARERGEATAQDPHTVAGAFLAILESNTIVHRSGYGSGDLAGMVSASVDLLLHGALACS